MTTISKRKPKKATTASSTSSAEGPSSQAYATNGDGTSNGVAPARKTKARKKRVVKSAAEPDTAPAKKKARKRSYGEVNEHGLREGTDLARALTIMLEGGKTRIDVVNKVRKTIRAKTRNGTLKAHPSIVANVLNQVQKRGYKIESHWRIVPPESKTAKARANK